MKELIVANKDDNKKLITYLSSTFPHLKLNNIYKALRKKDIRVNDVRISKDVIIHSNDVIKVYITDDILNGVSNNISIPVVFEDENIVVFNKPVGLEVEGPSSLTELEEKNYSFIKPCHRIDINTCGLVLYAKNQEALDILISKFKNEEIEKHYIALCYGLSKSSERTIDAYLFKDSKKSIVYITDSNQKGYVKIKTSYKVIDSNIDKKLSLLDVNLHTGRTHQIRAHLAHIGLPIIGDGKYGSYEINKRFKVYTQCLESYSLKFDFKNNNGILDYLNTKEIKLKKIPYTGFLQD